MKIKSFLAASVAAMTLFASCSNDDDVKGTEVIEGVKTMAKITLTQTSGNTRATVADNSQERNINEVRLYVFNNMGILEAQEDFEANANSKVFEVTTGDKTILAAVNMTSDLPTTIKGSTTLAQIKGALYNIEVDAISDATTPNKFWMTSLEDKSATIVAASEDQANSELENHITINVGRAVAKVGIYFNPIEEFGGKLSGVQYKIYNNPKQMRLFTSNDASGFLVTPFYDVAFSSDNYFNNPTYLNVNTTAFTDAPSFPSYMMENSNLIPCEGNATQVIIKGEFTPTKVCDANGENPENPINKTFYRGYDKTSMVYGKKYYGDEPTPAALQAEGCDEFETYTDGKCYYSLFLQDDTKNNASKYTVPRNTFWNVTINAVTGAGSSQDPDDDADPDLPPLIVPTDPIDAEVWMKATINVKAWTSVEQTSGI